MPTSFSISRARCTALSAVELQKEIRTYTGSDAEAHSIVRSLDRFGEDGSIRFYEVIPSSKRQVSRVASTPTWTVRAVR